MTQAAPIPFWSPRLFVTGCLLGVLFAAWWLLTGEPWEVLADGRQYLAMYRGEIAASPYGYRVLAPFLARLVPLIPQMGFAIVTIGCLILTSGVVALYAAPSRAPLLTSITMCALWGLSFPFVYLTTTQIRADAPMLLLMAVALILSRHRAPIWLLATLIAFGGLSHELILAAIAVLWLDKLTGGTLSGGTNYRKRDLALLSLVTLSFLFGVRQLIPTTTNQISYATTSPIELVRRVLAYSGGPLKHGLRIYAAFGPSLIFAMLFLARDRRSPDLKVFIGLGVISVMATFLATDTLRVMELAYLPVAFWAARYLQVTWDSGMRAQAVILLVAQAGYSVLVYGHLRSFEASRWLNLSAAILSTLTLLFCLALGFVARSRDARARLQAQADS